MSHDSTGKHLRHARMSIRSIVLISMGPASWTTEIENISATGVLVLRPEDWRAKAGERCALDLLVDDDLHIHLEATVARLTRHHVGFAYTRIPEDKESSLWNLLGRYADHLDQPEAD
jgi:hypothetical protein